MQGEIVACAHYGSQACGIYLNKIAEDDTYGSLSPAQHDMYINIETPKVYSNSSVAGADVIGGILKEDSEWKDIQFTTKDPEPEYGVTDYWLRGNRNEDMSNKWNECGINARVCENCNFVFWSR